MWRRRLEMRHPKLALIVSVLVSAVTAQQAWSDGMYVPAARGIALYDWTGLYAGLHLGGAWADTGAYDNQGYNRIGDAWGANSSGFLAGGQLGYNWQVGWLMLGLEGDIGDLGLNGNGTSHFAATNFDTSSATDADFYLTARGRLGIVADHWMIYATGGYFGAETRVSITDTCTIAPCGPSSISAKDSSFRSGWTAGGGIEASLGGPWTAKAEYLYYDLSDRTVSGLAGGAGPRFSWDLDTHGNMVRAGVNYRFTGF
jgi:outer membrane immunogenic protein